MHSHQQIIIPRFHYYHYKCATTAYHVFCHFEINNIILLMDNKYEIHIFVHICSLDTNLFKYFRTLKTSPTVKKDTVIMTITIPTGPKNFDDGLLLSALLSCLVQTDVSFSVNWEVRFVILSESSVLLILDWFE